MSNFKDYINMANEMINKAKNKNNNNRIPKDEKNKNNEMPNEYAEYTKALREKIEGEDKKDDTIEFVFKKLKEIDNGFILSSNKKIYYNNQKTAKEKIKEDFKLNDFKIKDYKTNSGESFEYKIFFK